jgi:ketosteroid isomerase-like protein
MGISHNEIMPENDEDIALVPEPQTWNKKIVKMLYKALAQGDTETIVRLVAADLEYWYHGPPQCQHMMKILTGESRHTEFKFKPRSIMATGELVITEGWDRLKAYWVHVWTLNKEGMIIQFREYFDTWLTVLLRASETGDEFPVWQTDPLERLHRSLPDLVLAI